MWPTRIQKAGSGTIRNNNGAEGCAATTAPGGSKTDSDACASKPTSPAKPLSAKEAADGLQLIGQLGDEVRVTEETQTTSSHELGWLGVVSEVLLSQPPAPVLSKCPDCHRPVLTCRMVYHRTVCVPTVATVGAVGGGAAVPGGKAGRGTSGSRGGSAGAGGTAANGRGSARGPAAAAPRVGGRRGGRVGRPSKVPGAMSRELSALGVVEGAGLDAAPIAPRGRTKLNKVSFPGLGGEEEEAAAGSGAGESTEEEQEGAGGERDGEEASDGEAGAQRPAAGEENGEADGDAAAAAGAATWVGGGFDARLWGRDAGSSLVVRFMRGEGADVGAPLGFPVTARRARSPAPARCVGAAGLHTWRGAALAGVGTCRIVSGHSFDARAMTAVARSKDGVNVVPCTCRAVYGLHGLRRLHSQNIAAAVSGTESAATAAAYGTPSSSSSRHCGPSSAVTPVLTSICKFACPGS